MEIRATHKEGVAVLQGALLLIAGFAANMTLMAGGSLSCVFTVRLIVGMSSRVWMVAVSCIEFGAAPQSWQVVLRGRNC